ncbi:hypothetical protein H2248_007456 [Termitomyces sp. 'cryptogamus']|nr:hypothetical protein H2248_007456 [Termitomyces sp. 'cryptogamus']
MHSIRKRRPFRPTDENRTKEEDEYILDEEEQEKLIETLKKENQSSNYHFITILRVLLILSSILQIISLFNNPLLTIFPTTILDTTPEIPLPIPFTLLNMFLHFNLALVTFPTELRSLNIFSEAALHSFPYQLTYAVAAVPPTLSMFLRKSWQSTAWWGVTILVVFTVQTVTYSINKGNESISELESMRYVSRGA